MAIQFMWIAICLDGITTFVKTRFKGRAVTVDASGRAELKLYAERRRRPLLAITAIRVLTEMDRLETTDLRDQTVS
jgi:hypothetical protein